MMQIHLYCPLCLAEMAKNGREKGFEGVPPILTDVHELLNDGVYTVHCSKGHKGIVVLKNLNYELLFDLGLNAIGDGYYHEAVASMTSSLERFFEFFIKTVWRIQGLQFDVIDKIWKEVSCQSERQLGAFVGCYAALFQKSVPLMSNSLKGFRNDVIHKGVIPQKEKTVEYASSVLSIIENSLKDLKKEHFETVCEVFEHYSPHYEAADDSEAVLMINHPTAINTCESLPETDNDKRRSIENLVEWVLSNREMKRMWLVGKEEKKLIEEDYKLWLERRIERQNREIAHDELTVTIDPNAGADVFWERLKEQIDSYDEIIEWACEEHPEMSGTDIMTIGLGNTQMLTGLYLLYLRVKILQLMLDKNPNDAQIKDKYREAEDNLVKYHEGLSYFD